MKRSAALSIQLISGVVAVTALLIFLFDRVVVTPDDTIMVAPFSDTEDLSLLCSEATLLDHSREHIRFHYKLGTTQEFPYIGFSLERDSLTWNLSRYSEILLRVEPDLSDRFTLQITTIVEGFTRSSNGLTYRLFEHNIDKINSSKIKLRMNDLKTPTWWFAANGIDISRSRSSLNRVTQLRFQSHPLSPREKEQHIYLKRVTFAHSPLRLLPFLMIGLLGVILPQLLKKRRDIPFVPLDISNRTSEELSILEEFLGREYSQLDLSLQKVVLNTGLSETTIRTLLKKYHHKGFKEYLNGIRITEGARLLRESDRQIAEIALFVGFRHPTTFTKLFREHLSLSPREYREKKR